MEAWARFWLVVLVLSLGVFALLAVVVSVGGLRDLRLLLRELGDVRDAGRPEDDGRGS